MAKLGQSSFRGILLSGILLISIPVLLIGGYMTYRKAHLSLLATARQNVTETAVRKAETTEKWLQLLKFNLISLSQSSVFQSQASENYQAWITQIQQQFPGEVTCLQLEDWSTNQVIASTCGNQRLSNLSKNSWPEILQNSTPNLPNVQVTLVPPELAQKISETLDNSNTQLSTEGVSQLRLALSAPVYFPRRNSRQLRYVLTVVSGLPLQVNSRHQSVTDYTVLIDENRRILEHLDPNKIGNLITQESEEDARNLEQIIPKAIAGESGVFHLRNFDPHQVEILAGYSAMPSPISTQPEQKWVILAITRLDYALSSLKDIQKVLIAIIFSLILAIIGGAVYLSRYLATPVEKLRDYALQVNDLESPQPVPHNFKIQEIEQLANALNLMVKRLTIWTHELEKASIEAQVANQLKNEFLANVSHELRTPLNGIIGAISIIKDDLCEDETEEQEWLERAEGASKHLLNIINDILDIARIESGTLSIFCATIDLNQVLEEAIDLEILEIQNKGLELIWSPPPKPILVYADPDKLQQVFLNILDNAIKFTDRGTITITTELESTTVENSSEIETLAEKTGQPSSQVLVKITDTGIGIDPEYQDKLFQPFVMVDGSTTRKYGGNGLGLAISRNILQLMAGRIILESKGLNQGTTITIQLPMYEEKSQPTLSEYIEN